MLPQGKWMLPGGETGAKSMLPGRESSPPRVLDEQRWREVKESSNQ